MSRSALLLLLLPCLALAQAAPAQEFEPWGRGSVYPLAACVGPLADPASYRHVSELGTTRACIDYSQDGAPRALLKHQRNGDKQSPLDIALNATNAGPNPPPQGLRLLDSRVDGQVELLVLALEYAPDPSATDGQPACAAPARREEVRVYAISAKEGREIFRQSPNPCLADGQASDSWARLARDFDRAHWPVISIGRGERPDEEPLLFNVDADGSIVRTFLFSM